MARKLADEAKASWIAAPRPLNVRGDGANLKKTKVGHEPSSLGESLAMEPVPGPSYQLEDLLAGVTDENLHGEVRTGAARGRETW